MNLLLISSSPHREKSSTFLLAKEVSKGAADLAVECEVIHLCDYKINFCRHCEECHKKILYCPIEDNVPAILKKMLEADGIILASPNYINQVNAPMKALFDRSSHFIHCKRLLDKYVVAVVSSGSGCDENVLDYIKFYAHICGAQYSGGVSSVVPLSQKKMEEAYKLGAMLAWDIKEEIKYPEQLEIIENSRLHFAELIKIRNSQWEEEYHYWLNKEWL